MDKHTISLCMILDMIIKVFFHFLLLQICFTIPALYDIQFTLRVSKLLERLNEVWNKLSCTLSTGRGGGCVTLPRDHPYLKDLAAPISGKITNLLNHPTDPIFTFIAQHRNCLLSIEAPGIMSCCKIIICNHFCGKAPLEPGFASTLLDDRYKRYTTAVLVHRFSYRRLDLSGA